jgi:hypothetical protein
MVAGELSDSRGNSRRKIRLSQCEACDMRGAIHRWLWLLLLFGQCAWAQTVIHDDENLAADRTEAWAMNYMAATTYMSGLGDDMAPGDWNAVLELGEIPPLSAAKRQVGLRGTKFEDLNKSPVFGRLRVSVGLPAGWVGEFGYTPPLAINGLRARGLFAAAFGRRLLVRDNWRLSARVFGQHGSVDGDITCPADIAGVSDPVSNPYGCQAASSDRVSLNYYGADIIAGGGRGDWHWHAGLGFVRTELAVHLDALTFSFRDRSRLTANGVSRYLVAGVGRDVSPRWRAGAEVLYVPLSVRRDPDAASGNEPLTSIRLQLRYQRK